jgi:hypothetical protein
MVEDIHANRCAVVVDGSLPLGLAANAASVITMTLGQRVNGLVGPDVKDADGYVHAGIVLIPVPILTAARDRVQSIREEVTVCPDVVAVGFSALAQSCKTYHEYIDRIALVPTCELEFVAVGVFGPRRLVNKLTGSLPLLR